MAFFKNETLFGEPRRFAGGAHIHTRGKNSHEQVAEMTAAGGSNE
jgi:hypothetical protein